MSDVAKQLKLPSLESHRNHYLFSDYYLKALLPQRPEWHAADAEARQALQDLGRLLAEKRPFLNAKVAESALEDQWIRPILDLLGHNYHVGASLRSPEGIRTPDYALFPDEAALRDALPHLGTADFFGAALAVGDAKRWDRSLDRRLSDSAGDAFSNANPSYQIDYYLRVTGRDCGLLTNGRLWRLYHRESSFRLDCYYEVDLVNLIEQGQVEPFKYFYLFFRRAAFPEFLNRVLRESREYAQGVSEDLKERVYEALRFLAEGFLKYPDTSLTPADLKEIHDNALILLYRLLFIFHAESRRLLPLENRSYAEVYSLKAVKEEIAQKLDRGVSYLPRRATIWDNLKALFHIINEGSPELGVPAYNGRLFDPGRYPFLEWHANCDAYLVQALDLLARAQGFQGLDFVDYRDLEIRHLGSIYEGLLEYQLRCADRDMAVVRDRKREWIVPAEEGQVAVFPAGSVYLVTDRGERKATGSYYTPDYIVKYIVENTLGPLVEEKQRAIQDRLVGLETKLKAARGENRKLLERELARVWEGFGEAVLELKVLDPAMGSGHFLVEATDYLAQRIVDFGVTLGAGAEGGEGPDETEISYWRRRVVESCIYGVDLNPLAVELAKLSLWLATAAKGKPLSFLDHHLRCGNSLIGARLEDLGSLPVRKKTKPVPEEQMALFDEAAFTRDVSLAVGGLVTIQELASDSVEDIHQKKRIFQELLEIHLKRWRQIADLWVSAYFGNEMAPEVYADLVQRVQTGKGMLPDAQAQPYLDRAHALWREKRFFHWELEFPEVFFDRYGRRKPNPGFDAVVGNPPYGALLDKTEKDWVIRRYSTVGWRAESYIAFSEAALAWIRIGGQSSLIVPDTWLNLKFTENLRTELLTEAWLRQIVALPNTVFPDAVVDTSIFVAQRTAVDAARKRQTRVVCYPKGTILSTLNDPHNVRNANSQQWLLNPYKIITVSASTTEERIVENVRAVSLPLESLASIKYGLKAYQEGKGVPKQTREQVNAKAFTSALRLTPKFQPFLEGREVYRYEDTWNEDNWILYGPWLAEPRTPELSEGPRLLFRKIVSETLVGTYLDEPAYNNTLLYVIKSLDDRHNLHFLLSVLNSQLLGFQFRIAYSISETDTFPQIMLKDIAQLPIRRILFTTPQEERARLGEIGITEATEFIEHTEGAASVSFSAFSASAFGRWLDERVPSPPTPLSRMGRGGWGVRAKDPTSSTTCWPTWRSR